MNYFFDLYQGKYKIDGMDYQESDFLLNQFWFKGHIACIKNEIPILCDFTGNQFNRYNYPIKVSLVPVKNDGAIPKEPQEVGTNVEICYCQKSRKPIRSIVELYVENIVDVEMLKNIDKRLTGDVLKILCDMGKGDELVIADAKRNDIGTTATAYAEGIIGKTKAQEKKMMSLSRRSI